MKEKLRHFQIKTKTKEKKPTKFVAGMASLQEILKGILQTEVKDTRQ